MPLSYSTRAIVTLITPLLVTACATKGFVRNQVALSRAATDSAIAMERDARVAADNDLASRIASLRGDLDAMRTEFGAKISSVEGALKFAMPVTFAFNDATVSGEARTMLERFASVARKYYGTSTITVEGFADPAGSVQYNLALSRDRAENVLQTLQALGLTTQPLRAVGYGESRLVTPGAEKDDPGAQGNRRVVFVIENAGAEAAIALGPSIR
jgi:outer membrane protein OmpA-like peptidoglycan-associated protein